ncbi:MAG: antitoxin Xre/MbcA/ParS toxin-binding domain-containing protein, partial [Candidatus Binataceae bacterium]
RRTLSHRISRGQRLNPEESGRVARVVRIFALASATLGGTERATRWLHRPLRQFGNRTPMEMLATDVGTNQMEVLLGRIAHGIAA